MKTIKTMFKLIKFSNSLLKTKGAKIIKFFTQCLNLIRVNKFFSIIIFVDF